MMRNTRGPATLRRLSLVIVALAWIGIGPAATQDIADDFEILSSDVADGESVAVLVTGWHPVTGEEPDIQAKSDGGGMVAFTGDEFVEAISSTGHVSEVRRYEFLPVIAMTMDSDALTEAKNFGEGVRVWKDRPVEPLLSESGPMVGANQAHVDGYTGMGAWIAVIDTGVDVDHPFIAGRPIIEACFASHCPNGRQRMVGDGAARPVHHHGTHVAGIALGYGGDMSGVAPQAGLIAINVFNPSLGASDSNILAALDWLIRLAWHQPITIASINMSLGGPPQQAVSCRRLAYSIAVNLLARRNVAIVAASGNDSNTRGISNPACVDGVVSVGAIDKESRVAQFSNSAPILDIFAPGVDVNSAVPKGDGSIYAALDGTSMAAPHVAGAFAVLRQAAPSRSVSDLYRALVGSGDAVRDRRNGITKPSLDVASALWALGVRSGADAASPDDGGAAQEEEGGWQPIGK